MHEPAESAGADDERFGARHDPYDALRLPAFRRYLSGNFLAVLGMQMQTMAVGWEVYELKRNLLYTGLVGLAQVGPVILLGLFAGHVADRFDRKRVLIAALLVLSISSLVLAAISLAHWPLWAMYACLVMIGSARAFQQPAKSSLLPTIVPRARFANAVTWSSGAFQLASVAGPALGGLVIAATGRAAVVYLVDAATAVTFAALLLRVQHRRGARGEVDMTLASLLVGFRFLGQSPVVLAAITLDLFAVLLGGATALLPAYAREILYVGPTKLGLLAAAPAIGALVMAVFIAHRPPMQRAGQSLLAAVTGFGVATIVFGLSHVYWLSLVALLMTGAVDAVSVVVRHSLVQLLTPDHMRGRVSAVNGMFISASNELGAFESGGLGWLTSATFSVVAGGVGTLLVVLAVAILCPQLRRYGRLAATEPQRASASV